MLCASSSEYAFDTVIGLITYSCATARTEGSSSPSRSTPAATARVTCSTICRYSGVADEGCSSKRNTLEVSEDGHKLLYYYNNTQVIAEPEKCINFFFKSPFHWASSAERHEVDFRLN